MSRFCTQCGAAVSEAARFCNKCGERLAPTKPTSAGQAAPASDAGNTPTLIEPITSFNQPPPGEQPIAPPSYQSYQTPPAHSELAPNIAGLLCYPLSIFTGILFLSLSAYNRDRFVRFHAYQSIFFFVALMVFNLALNIFGIIVPAVLEKMLSASLQLLGLGGTVWLMYQAYLGVMFKLPLIGDLAENQSLKS